MKIHEYQAKEILRRHGVAVPRGLLASSPEEAEAAASQLGGTTVVKAQIHAGGRGKGGGVKLAHTPAEAKRSRPGHAGHDARDAPDRALGTAGAEGLRRGGLPHRAGALPGPHPRPGRGPVGPHGLHRGRRGHRGGGGKGSPRRSCASAIDPLDRARPLPGSQDGLPAGAQRGCGGGLRSVRLRALPGLPRHGRIARRDESARRHRGGRGPGARRQDELRRQRACFATRSSPPCGIPTRRIPRRPWPRSRTCRTSPCTATSAAW